MSWGAGRCGSFALAASLLRCFASRSSYSLLRCFASRSSYSLLRLILLAGVATAEGGRGVPSLQRCVHPSTASCRREVGGGECTQSFRSGTPHPPPPAWPVNTSQYQRPPSPGRARPARSGAPAWQGPPSRRAEHAEADRVVDGCEYIHPCGGVADRIAAPWRFGSLRVGRSDRCALADRIAAHCQPS